MKFSRLAILVVSLLTAGASTASAAPATASGPAALALAGVVALYSPLLTADEREAVSAFFVGQSGVRYAKKISVTADKVVCRVSNVDITARSCELTFKGAKQTIAGRRASEIFATEAMAGIPADGAAGSVFESLSKLNCTLDPAEIKQKAGGGASARSTRTTEPPEANGLSGAPLPVAKDDPSGALQAPIVFGTPMHAAMPLRTMCG
jgi:hypothetical protein